MRLLVLTQAVDTEEQLLGFFHRWLEVFSTRFDQLRVVCLKEGAHQLPNNVFVHSLGKEGGRSRLKYVIRLFRYIWKYRAEYDAVFVHMNQEYVLLAGVFWRLSGKRIVLWRNHKRGSWRTRIAVRLAHTICYTSPDAYVASFPRAVQMPIGIDTDAFAPQAAAGDGSILMLGRLDPVKRVDVFVAALELLAESGSAFAADIYGDPSEGNETYAHDVRNQAGVLALEGKIRMHAGVSHSETPAIYAAHHIYVNLTPSGSFDKTIGEALAAGCIVVAANAAVRHVIPPPLFIADESAQSVAAALGAALSLRAQDRAQLIRISRDYIEREHSLVLLADRLARLLA